MGAGAIKVPSIFTAVDKFSKPVQKMERSGVSFAEKMEAKLSKADRVVNKLTPSFGALGNQVLGFIGIAGGIALADKMAEIQQRTEAARRTIQQFTGDTGVGLDTATAKVAALVNQFDQDFNEVVVAGNSLSKQMGISFETAIDKISQGFIVGADNSGELLAIIKEYPVFMREAGLSADAFFNVINQQVKQGIYSDKGIDAIKEANIRLREAPKATIDALEGIGLSSSKLLKGLKDGSLTTFDVMQKVSERLSKLPANSQAVGTAIADIFGGPGEDAGLKFLNTIQFIDKKTGDLSSSFGAVEKSQAKLLAANTRLELAYNKLFGGTNEGIMNLKAGFMEFVAEGLLQIAPAVNNIINVSSKWLRENGSMLFNVIKVILIYITVLKAVKVAIALVRGATLAWNTVVGINTVLQGKSLFALRANTVAMNAAAVTTRVISGAQKAWIAVNTILTGSIRAVTAAMLANPIGLIVAGIIAVIFAVRAMIKNWEKWGRIVALLSGPLGFIIFVVKTIADNWDKVVSAFKDGGIIGAIKAIGKILMKAVFETFMQLEEIIMKVWGRIKGPLIGVIDKLKLQFMVLKGVVINFLLKPLKTVLAATSKIGIGSDAFEALKKFDDKNKAETVANAKLLLGDQTAEVAASGPAVNEEEVVRPVNLEAERQRAEIERQESIERGVLDINVNDPGGNVTVDDSRAGGIPIKTQPTFGF